MIDESEFEGRPLCFCLKNKGWRLVVTAEDGVRKEFKRTGKPSQPQEVFTFRGDVFRLVDSADTPFSYWFNEALIGTRLGQKMWRNVMGYTPSRWEAA
ncbi:hypothetical protein [Micromonospora carbonacea]|uniref:hypothetical protein n=1 Tax=Micromonospora carbonacea TaxID=47853 RepID=UPI003D7089C5